MPATAQRLLRRLVCLAWILAGSEVGAAPVVERLEVALWPEYDRSAMLVMLRGELAADTPLPADLSLPMAPGVTAPHAVAWAEADGRMKVAQYTVRAAEGRHLVEASFPGRSFRLEYYVPLVREPGDTLRVFTFEWPGDPGVGALGYEFQVPPGAEDVVLSPPSASSAVGSDGLTYLSGEVGAVASGETATIQVAYRRASDGLTAPASAAADLGALLPPPPSAAGPATAVAAPAGERPKTPWWPVYVAAALLVGILVGMGIQRMGR